MNRRLLQVLTMCSALVSATAGAETLDEYVNNCKSDMVIDTALPALDCNNGVLFAPNHGSVDQTNDYLGYSRVNDAVDIAFACRWLGPLNSQNKFTTAASVEMLLHNRLTGRTCYFAAKNPTATNSGVSTALVALDDTANASNYWMQPAELDSFVDSQNPNAHLRCVECHAAGPYIASPRIAPFLARFGLLNNGHDTNPDFNVNDMIPGPHYSQIGSSPPTSFNDPTNTSAFRNWANILMAQFNDTDSNLRPDPTCAGTCHAIGLRSTNNGLTLNGSTLIPSLSADIAAVVNVDSNNRPIQIIMPPTTVTYSDYRWFNVDTPTNVATGDTGDIETLQRLQQQYPTQWPQLACSNPAFVQAHVVGSDAIYDTSGYQDKLHAFNLRDGLTCLSAEQTGSHACLDYQTRYQCTSGPSPLWTPWINSASSAPNDHEERSSKSVATTIFAVCGSNVNPVGIQAKFTVPGTTNVVVIDGPPDRLAQFNSAGLRCNNGDQGVGQSCSNYVVRFICPTTPGISTLPTRHIPPGLKTVLTESTSTVDQGINNQIFQPNGQAQQWIIEPVTDFSNRLLWTISVADRSRAVRLRSQWTGFYATSNDVNKGPNASSPFFWLLAQALRQTWTTQVWIKEPVPPPFEFSVRLRSAWIPPPSKSAFTQLYMTLTTAKNNDIGTQDVFIQPFQNNGDGSALDLQTWLPMGVGGP